MINFDWIMGFASIALLAFVVGGIWAGSKVEPDPNADHYDERGSA